MKKNMKKKVLNVMIVSLSLVAFVLSVNAFAAPQDLEAGILYGSLELHGNSESFTPIKEKDSQIGQYFTTNSAITVLTNPCNECKFNYVPHYFEGDEDKTSTPFLNAAVGQRAPLNSGSMYYSGRVYVGVSRADFTLLTTYQTYRWDYNNVLGLD